jgi:hypothetical protein
MWAFAEKEAGTAGVRPGTRCSVDPLIMKYIAVVRIAKGSAIDRK